MSRIDCMASDVPTGLPTVEVPLVRATNQTLEGYRTLVDDPEAFEIEIVTWPAAGWRAIDESTGGEGGTTPGTFEFWWEGTALYGQNDAVGDRYLLGWAGDPSATIPEAQESGRPSVLLWHANYHPDGGQLFFPIDGISFVAPLALPGDDLAPEQFVAFYIDGGKGLYIHPNVWHEGVFPLADTAKFYDEQGKVHARVSCNIANEFGVLLEVPLRTPD